MIEHCKAFCARQRIPEIVVSDNGPQFSLWEFLTFSDKYGFTHLTSSPYHPQGNSEAEYVVQTLKNLLKKVEDLYIVKLNYRATPLQNGSSPEELLMGRKLRTRVLTVPSNMSHPSQILRCSGQLTATSQAARKKTLTNDIL